MFNGLYLDFINIDACTKFDKNPSINSQDIEHKQNSYVNQGPDLYKLLPSLLSDPLLFIVVHVCM